MKKISKYNTISKSMFILPIFFLGISTSTWAQKLSNKMVSKSMPVSSQKVKANNAKSENSDLDTSFSFDGTKIKGKVNSSHLRKVTVENDKSVNDLLGIRTNFSDREVDESERSLKW